MTLPHNPSVIADLLILRIHSDPSSPFSIYSTSLVLHTFSYSHDVPYPAFSTALLIAVDDLLQSALQGHIRDQDLVPTTISEWHEDGTVLKVHGKGLTMADLGSSIRGLGQWAQRWGFDQRGVSGIWTVEQIGTGNRCDLMVAMDLSGASSKNHIGLR